MKSLFLLLLLLSGCAISDHGVFPKLVWYWSVDAQLQREYDKDRKEREKAYRESLKENSK